MWHWDPPAQLSSMLSIGSTPHHLIIHWQGCCYIFLASHYVLFYLQYQWHLLVICIPATTLSLNLSPFWITKAILIPTHHYLFLFDFPSFMRKWYSRNASFSFTKSLTFRILENYHLYLLDLFTASSRSNSHKFCMISPTSSDFEKNFLGGPYPPTWP